MSEPKRKLLGMDHVEMQAVVKEMGMPGFAARQMMEWVYVKRARSIDDMTNLSLKHREALRSESTSSTYPAAEQGPSAGEPSALYMKWE